MKKLIATLLIATSLSAPAFAFQSGTSSTGAVAMGDTGTATTVLGLMNKKGQYAADFYRLSFMQLMGLVFFDPNTPDIGSCQKEMLNYHLPQVANQYVNLEAMRADITKIMAEVYTAQELSWMQQFYTSPFGERMYRKQLDMNDRIARLIAQRYGSLKPQFQDVYKTVAERCGGGPSTVPVDAPKLSDEILMPTNGSAPIPASPERVGK